jgi:hypothetical protein
MFKWVMQAHFRHLHFNSFPMLWKLFKLMGFDSCNCTLKIRKSIGTLIPNMEFTWECEGSFLHTFCTPGSMWCDSWVFLLAYNLATPCFNREPKARVADICCFLFIVNHYNLLSFSFLLFSWISSSLLVITIFK